MTKNKIPRLVSLWYLASASLIYSQQTPSKVPPAPTSSSSWATTSESGTLAHTTAA